MTLQPQIPFRVHEDIYNTGQHRRKIGKKEAKTAAGDAPVEYKQQQCADNEIGYPGNALHRGRKGICIIIAEVSGKHFHKDFKGGAQKNIKDIILCHLVHGTILRTGSQKSQHLVFKKNSPCRNDKTYHQAEPEKEVEDT